MLLAPVEKEKSDDVRTDKEGIHTTLQTGATTEMVKWMMTKKDGASVDLA